jgi:hypothetical protein
MGRILTIWAIVGLLICFCGMINSIVHEKETVKVNCYDAEGSIIIGQSCDKEILTGNGETIDMTLMILFVMNVFLTPMVLFQTPYFAGECAQLGKEVCG